MPYHPTATESHFGGPPKPLVSVHEALAEVLALISSQLGVAAELNSQEATLCLQTLNIQVTALLQRVSVKPAPNYRLNSIPPTALIEVIKAVKAHTGMSLGPTRAWVESGQPLFSEILRVDEEQDRISSLARTLAELGCVVVPVE